MNDRQTTFFIILLKKFSDYIFNLKCMQNYIQVGILFLKLYPRVRIENNSVAMIATIAMYFIFLIPPHLPILFAVCHQATRDIRYSYTSTMYKAFPLLLRQCNFSIPHIILACLAHVIYSHEQRVNISYKYNAKMCEGFQLKYEKW